MKTSVVYFFHDTTRQLIKIGVSRQLRDRLSYLSSDRKTKLEFLGYLAGDYHKEAEIHEMFSELRCEGEWFNVSSELLEYINLNAIHELPPLPLPPIYERRNHTITRDDPLFYVLTKELNIPPDGPHAIQIACTWKVSEQDTEDL